jgi:hypothetical protein
MGDGSALFGAERRLFGALMVEWKKWEKWCYSSVSGDSFSANRWILRLILPLRFIKGNTSLAR